MSRASAGVVRRNSAARREGRCDRCFMSVISARNGLPTSADSRASGNPEGHTPHPLSIALDPRLRGGERSEVSVFPSPYGREGKNLRAGRSLSVPSPGGRGDPSEARAGEGLLPLKAFSPSPVSRSLSLRALATLSLWERERTSAPAGLSSPSSSGRGKDARDITVAADIPPPRRPDLRCRNLFEAFEVGWPAAVQVFSSFQPKLDFINSKQCRTLRFLDECCIYSST